MQLDLNNLPTDTELLHRLVRDIVGKIEHRDGEIERLKSIIKQLQRAQFGRRSERLDPDQLALGLEEIEGDLAREEESRPPAEKQPTERSSRHKPLPGHLAREDVRLDIDDMTCTCCGGTLHVIGQSVSEMLDWIPAQLRVIRTTRPKYACRTCETVVQAPAPERVIAGGLATPALLAQVLVSKYCDHTRRSIDNRRYLRATASISHGRLSPDGLAAPAGGSRRCMNACARMCSPRTICSPTTRRCRCSIPDVGGRRPDVSGSMPGSSAAGAGRSRR
jgi:transposase